MPGPAMTGSSWRPRAWAGRSRPARARQRRSNGADALGLEVGSLEVGRLADFIRLETDDPRMVPGVTDEELVAHVVWAGDRALVTDVWVGGRQLVTRGSCTTVDRRRAHREVRERAQRIRESGGS